MFDWLKQYNKAIISAVAAAALMFLKAYVGDHTLSDEEIWQIIGAAAAAGGFTFAVPNVPKPTAPPAKE
jgi:hypothetical protein